MLDDELYEAYKQLEMQMEEMPLAERIDFSISEIQRIIKENNFIHIFSGLSKDDIKVMEDGDPTGKFDQEEVEAYEIYSFLLHDMSSLIDIKSKLANKEQIDESSLFELMMNVQDDIILSD